MINFRYYQTIKTRPIVYNSDPEFCNKLVRHDPRMLSAIKDIGLDIATEMINKSSVYVRNIDFHSIDDAIKIFKIAEASFKKNAKSRKFLYRILFNFLLEDYKLTEPETKALANIFSMILKKYPIVLLVLNFKILKQLSDIGIDIDNILSKINYSKITKGIQSFIDSERNRYYSNSLFNSLTFLDFNYYYSWDSNLFLEINEKYHNPSNDDVLDHLKKLDQISSSKNKELEGFILWLSLKY